MAENVRGVGNQTRYFRVNPSICQRIAKKGRSIWKKKATAIGAGKGYGMCQIERPYTDMTDDLLPMQRWYLRQSRSAPGLWYKCWRAPKGTCRGVGQTCSYKQARPCLSSQAEAALECCLCPAPAEPCASHALRYPLWSTEGLMQHQQSVKASSRGSWAHPRDKTEQPLRCSSQLGGTLSFSLSCLSLLLCPEQGKAWSTEEGTETDAELKHYGKKETWQVPW